MTYKYSMISVRETSQMKMYLTNIPYTWIHRFSFHQIAETLRINRGPKEIPKRQKWKCCRFGFFEPVYGLFRILSSIWEISYSIKMDATDQNCESWLEIVFGLILYLKFNSILLSYAVMNGSMMLNKINWNCQLLTKNNCIKCLYNYKRCVTIKDRLCLINYRLCILIVKFKEFCSVLWNFPKIVFHYEL